MTNEDVTVFRDLLHLKHNILENGLNESVLKEFVSVLPKKRVEKLNTEAVNLVNAEMVAKFENIFFSENIDEAVEKI